MKALVPGIQASGARDLVAARDRVALADSHACDRCADHPVATGGLQRKGARWR